MRHILFSDCNLRTGLCGVVMFIVFCRYAPSGKVYYLRDGVCRLRKVNVSHTGIFTCLLMHIMYLVERCNILVITWCITSPTEICTISRRYVLTYLHSFRVISFCDSKFTVILRKGVHDIIYDAMSCSVRYSMCKLVHRLYYACECIPHHVCNTYVIRIGLHLSWSYSQRNAVTKSQTKTPQSKEHAINHNDLVCVLSRTWYIVNFITSG